MLRTDLQEEKIQCGNDRCRVGAVPARGETLRDDQKADCQKALDKQPTVVANRELEQSLKRLRRLSGWHRIGITASILWLFFGAFWGYKVGDLEAGQTNVQWRFDCRGKYGNPVKSPPSKAPVTAKGGTSTLDMDSFIPDSPTYDVDGIPVPPPPQMDASGFYIDPVTGERLDVFDWCDQQSQQLWPALDRNTWRYTALYSLVPIPLGWLTAYGIIALVCWIRTGFKVPTSPN